MAVEGKVPPGVWKLPRPGDDVRIAPRRLVTAPGRGVLAGVLDEPDINPIPNEDALPVPPPFSSTPPEPTPGASSEDVKRAERDKGEDSPPSAPEGAPSSAAGEKRSVRAGPPAPTPAPENSGGGAAIAATLWSEPRPRETGTACYSPPTT